ncbi:uncharacterized protein LOC126657427 [Mercurialis annua]|uniref:uncharacterized protein LOC126657427 n=1 Tax=Mercurialis annua TaxID=3986 RepID=UPI0021607CBF|nr:uncharacterized protein LOC126657427 [Mercurialis annua]
MAYEIPYDQIRELQISLRKQAGLASYNPDEEDISLPNLPSIKDAISQLDPSPSYLRCKHCNGRLLRGVNSIICVFCGRQQNKEVPPDPVQFTSTFGCRWFLHSLDLDGSELVAPSIEGNESSRGKNAPEVEFPLSDLLNLEIRWPSEPDKIETSVSEKTLNLGGVDIDNYFAESKNESVSASTERQFALNKHEDASGSNAFQGHDSLSFFENAEPSKTAAMYKEDESSDWEPDFQSSNSGSQPQEPKFSDPFVGSSSVDLSSHMDAVFGSGKDLTNEKIQENMTSASNMNDWLEGDIWSNANAGGASQNYEFEVPVNDEGQGIVGKADNFPPMNVDWIQGNQWETSGNSHKEADKKAINEDDDSFDDWNDFTSSSNAQVPSSDALKDDNQTVSFVEQGLGMSLFSGTDDSKDAYFSSFPSDFISAASSNQNGSTAVNSFMPETSIPNRMASIEGIDGGSSEEFGESRDFCDGNTKSKASNVEALMSQMHDLSFMLESNLSVPQKNDPQTIDPFSPFTKD